MKRSMCQRLSSPTRGKTCQGFEDYYDSILKSRRLIWAWANIPHLRISPNSLFLRPLHVNICVQYNNSKLLRSGREEKSRGSWIASAETNRRKVFELASVGNMCIDIMLPISHYPISNGRHQTLRSGAQIEVGGSLNALISASRLNAKTAAIAYTSIERSDGNPSDALFSAYLRNSAEREGIDISALLQHTHRTVQTCAALINEDGAHTFLASNEEQQTQANSKGKIPQPMREVVEQSQVLMIDGYAFHSDRDLIEQCMEVAVESQCAIWIDPQAATASLLKNKDTLFMRVLKIAEGITLNMDEARIITGENDPKKAIKSLPFFSSAKTILLKDGPHGCHAYEKCRNGDIFSSVPGFNLKEKYKDSIGAGDAFVGAFLAGKLVHSLDLPTSCLLANAMAAGTCMKHGAGSFGISSSSDVERLLSVDPPHKNSARQVLTVLRSSGILGS